MLHSCAFYSQFDLVNRVCKNSPKLFILDLVNELTNKVYFAHFDVEIMTCCDPSEVCYSCVEDQRTWYKKKKMPLKFHGMEKAKKSLLFLYHKHFWISNCLC